MGLLQTHDPQSLADRPISPPREISSGRALMIDTRAQQKVTHTYIILVIVKHHLVQIGGIDVSIECLS